MAGADRGHRRSTLWAAVHAERAALLADLEPLHDRQWTTRSLCSRWTVEQVVAHLTAAASVGWSRWLRSMVGAGFDAGRHNDRRLAEHLGPTPAATLAGFRGVVESTVAPTGDVPAWLGEVVVHGQDVRHPLGLPRRPAPAVVAVVAEFYARRDFTVRSGSAAAGLHLVATDSGFRHGPSDASLVRGSTLALTMALAGRSVFCDELDGAGVPVLRERAGG
ncbi:maleylpyruvate isomerase family mycothiol-dependent enzyme [Aquipuribacter sp. SD81]|uniref:maleylpyruvate isomerase family mycothiol-dependent enzyme n=1 Tax=Aquipuribacter sp. SD81 TaxID=3127703 RepID=UPI0030199A97